MSETREEKAESVQLDLSNPDVCTKYQAAAVVANKALKTVLDACKDGADAFELCEMGNNLILEEVGKLYNKKGGEKKDKAVPKGIAFPTCVSINEVAANFSPLKGESRQIRGGDIVKVELGVQIDGFIAQAGHTVLVPEAEGGAVSDRRADVVQAAWTAAEAALRTIKVGVSNTLVTQHIQEACDQFKCQPVQGVLSHELKQMQIDGAKVILGKETDTDKVDAFEFGLHEVYTVDVMVSTGDGKMRETDERACVYKRALETSYQLKTAKARQFIAEVNRRFPTLPFSLACIEEEQCARVGVSESRRHNLLHEYPVMAERPGELVAGFKFTVLLLPGGTKKITGLTFEQADKIQSQYQVESENLKKVLAATTNTRKPRKKKE